MKRTYIFPDQFDHRFTTYITFYGSEKKVLCAFDVPEDVHVWLHDTEFDVTYDISSADSRRIESFANEILEQV
jgi:hypothetical protein